MPFDTREVISPLRPDQDVKPEHTALPPNLIKIRALQMDCLAPPFLDMQLRQMKRSRIFMGGTYLGVGVRIQSSPVKLSVPSATRKCHVGDCGAATGATSPPHRHLATWWR